MNENPQKQADEKVDEVPTTSEETVTPPENKTSAHITGKKKPEKKKIIIFSVIAVVIVAAIIAAIMLIPTEFDKVEKECLQIAGQLASGRGYFTIDTYPDSYENMDSTARALLLPGAQKKALEAIQYANNEFGFPDSVYTQMKNTSAIMGRQTEENDKYQVSWFYDPDSGLEVTYRKK